MGDMITDIDLFSRRGSRNNGVTIMAAMVIGAGIGIAAMKMMQRRKSAPRGRALE